jgi:hypothetical protein
LIEYVSSIYVSIGHVTTLLASESRIWDICLDNGRNQLLAADNDHTIHILQLFPTGTIPTSSSITHMHLTKINHLNYLISIDVTKATKVGSIKRIGKGDCRMVIDSIGKFLFILEADSALLERMTWL